MEVIEEGGFYGEDKVRVFFLDGLVVEVKDEHGNYVRSRKCVFGCFWRYIHPWGIPH